MSDLIGLSYTREMELEADRFAATLLEGADIRRDGLLQFFERLERRSAAAESTLAFLSTHPPTEERVRVLRADQGGKPAMSDEDWAALKQVCRTKEMDPLAVAQP